MKITNEIVKNHGLTTLEFKEIKSLIGREPNLVELGIFSAMWNEHCSYKSSKVHLKKLPTKNEIVIQGPGENAGVIDIKDGDAIVFKIESHNHPSYIEPFQGAATGVGGILRDVFTMGARPIALLNSIHFGDVNHKKTKHLLNGVVSGIGGYGNCIGIPTVAGETKFNESYNENILVNAMAVGLAKKDKIFYSKAKGINKPVVYVGSKTGRDGIHGASMASAEFDENSEEKKPTVQVGDPFTEKLLLESCLELMRDKSIIAIQDMGAAGLTSSSVEMASKGGLGIELELNKVPIREQDMTPYEIMLSESQERMLIILEEGKEDYAKKIFEKWDLDFSIIGKTTATNRLVLKFDNETVADLPLSALSDKAPMYERKSKKIKLPKKFDYKDKIKKFEIKDLILKLISHPNFNNKNWITSQFDQLVMGDTILRSGSDAAIIKAHDTNKGIAVTVDSSAKFCAAFPLYGGKQIIAECWRNLIAVGAKPLAVTNCLNFGNPENPEIMGQFTDCLKGMKEACVFLNMPIVSGNVSFYNGTNQKNIDPTPVIGGVGLITNLDRKLIDHKLKKEGNIIIKIGKTFGHLYQSALFLEILNLKDGPPPEVNLTNEKNNGEMILKLVSGNLIESCHDISSGGTIMSLFEMAIGGNLGLKINKLKSTQNYIEYFFGEDQGRYLIEVSKANLSKVIEILKKDSIAYQEIATVIKENIELESFFEFKISELDNLNQKWFNDYNAN